MSVLIKGIEMPKNCLDCPCLNGEEMYCQATGKNLGLAFASLYKASGCPLVEIPPHGRLIDADEFIKGHCNLCDGACENTYCDCLSCKETMRCDMIQNFSNAPTIIESEGE